MSYPPPPDRGDLPPPQGRPGDRQQGKGLGVLLFFFAVIPGLFAVAWAASVIDFRLQLPAALLAAAGALALIRRKVGEQAMIGCLIAFGATAVVAGGACIALLAAFANSY